MLAPLAGIGNWFVRLQAKLYGPDSGLPDDLSFAIHYVNRRRSTNS